MQRVVQRLRSSWRRLAKLLIVALLVAVAYFGIRGSRRDVPAVVHLPPVPNVVHFVHFINKEDGKHQPEAETLDFVSATCILAVYLNHGPDKVIYHTNVKPDVSKSKLWSVIFRVLPSSRFEVRETSRPTHVFGQRLTSVQHSSDVKRLQILSSEGGITLDSDTFVVRKLDEFFDFDCTIGWPKNQSIGNQIVLARPNAEFIRLWLDSYRDYRPFLWYYNAGDFPTQHILGRRPALVNRIETSFGVDNLASKLYSEQWSDWKNLHAVHLLARHRSYLVKDDVEKTNIEVFDEVNIQGYNNTFGEMARSIWNHDLVRNSLKHSEP